MLKLYIKVFMKWQNASGELHVFCVQTVLVIPEI